MGFLESLGGALDPMDFSGNKKRDADKAMSDAADRSALMTMGAQRKAERRATKRLTAGEEKARAATKEGFGAARTAYSGNPNIVASREQLYDRIMGNAPVAGVNNARATTTEQAGLAMRDVQNALNDQFGDASGGGMTGENLARALTGITATKAGGLRDIDTYEGQQKESMRREATAQAYQDAAIDAGLSVDEAKMLANSFAQEGGATGSLAYDSGTNIASILANRGALDVASREYERGALGDLVDGVIKAYVGGMSKGGGMGGG